MHNIMGTILSALLVLHILNSIYFFSILLGTTVALVCNAPVSKWWRT